MAAGGALPVVDLAPFFTNDDGGGVARATEAVREACRTHGFFRVINHGVPAELMAHALELSAAFFALPDDEKAKARQAEGAVAPLPAGYRRARAPAPSADKHEFLMMFDPQLGLNEYPAEPAGFREAVQECYVKFTKLGLLLQEVLNECMDLPPGFLMDYNGDRGFDFMTAHHYLPATEEENDGINAHEDGSCVTFVIENGVGGLEFLKDGDRAPAEPVDGSIIVNIGDIMQVLSNNTLKSATHRVVRKPAHRYSLAFFFNFHGDKWIEPLPEFTAKIGKAPRYRGFVLDEYLQRRMRELSTPEEVVHNNNITHYAI